MKKTNLLFSMLAMIAVLSGCAGTNFKRPEANAVLVGKSTQADVVQIMGQPLRTGEALKNDQKIKTLRYGYAEGAGTGLYPGVVPARAMVFSTFNDVVVGHEFVSSFPQDGTDFDESKLSSIIKGKSTRSEVIATLGKPNGEAIYPLIKKQGEKALVYAYTHAKGSVFDMKFYSKALLIAFDSNDVVSEIDYTSNGVK